MIAVDTNVLISAHRAETYLHAAAAGELVVLASPSCRIVRPGSDFVSLLTAASLEAGARGNLVFDAQIVALCREHGISTILTNDRDFRRLENPRVRLLGELA